MFGRGKRKKRGTVTLSQRQVIPVHLRGRYDAATTTDNNRRHWTNADTLSADKAMTPTVRKTLRARARYEVANNSYARGIVLTLANDCIGTGPRLQLLTENAETNRRVEAAFVAWSKSIGLPEKLRTMRMARASDGEAFAILASNDNLPGSVKLDLRLVEADQVATPAPSSGSVGASLAVDGIEFDPFGNPAAYHVLKNHPGGSTSPTAKADRISASSMIHWFRTDRPGQHRGLPEIMPALDLFGMLRQYSLAVLGSAKIAANQSLVIYSDAPANGEAADIEPMDTIELEQNMATTLPDGWKLGQMKAEQPTTTFDMFKHEILNEIARCLNMPYNIAAGNSSGYNYASGRLDHQTYYKSIRVDQSQAETVVIDRIFTAWLAEARFALNLSPADDVVHQWFWDGTEHVDPLKEAKAQSTRLASHTTTLAAEFARQGKDWESELHQRAKEVALMKELGLGGTGLQPVAEKTNDEDEDDEDESEAEAEKAAA